jgi:hypothetical protein
VFGKASKLKKHARELCPLRKAVQEEAAAEAIMQKLQEGWVPIEEPTLEQQIQHEFTREELDQLKIRLADEEVLNAEGD